MQGQVPIFPHHFEDVLDARAQFQVVAGIGSGEAIERSHLLPFQLAQQRDFIKEEAVEIVVVGDFEVSVVGAETVVVE